MHEPRSRLASQRFVIPGECSLPSFPPGGFSHCASPELLQDPARDFSLYVLDPLEAQPLPTSLAHAPHNTSSPRGVAVALGLMSWALESNDSTDVFVTGTVIHNASPALEVVFALREVCSFHCLVSLELRIDWFILFQKNANDMFFS